MKDWRDFFWTVLHIYELSCRTPLVGNSSHMGRSNRIRSFFLDAFPIFRQLVENREDSLEKETNQWIRANTLSVLVCISLSTMTSLVLLIEIISFTVARFAENTSSPSSVFIFWVHHRYTQCLRSVRRCWRCEIQTMFIFIYSSTERVIVGNSIVGQRRGWMIDAVMVFHLMCLIKQLLATSLNILHPLVWFMERSHSICVLKQRSSRTVETER